MDAMIAKAQRSDLHPGLRQILGSTVIVNRMIGSLRRDDEGWDVGKIGKATRRCLLLPAGNEIRSIRLRLLFDFQVRRIVYRWIIGDRDVGNPPNPRLLSAEVASIGGVSLTLTTSRKGRAMSLSANKSRLKADRQPVAGPKAINAPARREPTCAECRPASRGSRRRNARSNGSIGQRQKT